jgi:hypothetical protein
MGEEKVGAFLHSGIIGIPAEGANAQLALDFSADGVRLATAFEVLALPLALRIEGIDGPADTLLAVLVPPDAVTDSRHDSPYPVEVGGPRLEKRADFQRMRGIVIHGEAFPVFPFLVLLAGCACNPARPTPMSAG